ncbi:MAG TPA: redoxin family protein [Humisphaera sp.]|jgi:thiol-disulfide isomerase/thioredoxin|nr:redoxin family protein [Humisphaera sp.]
MKRARSLLIIFGLLLASKATAAKGAPVDPTLFVGDPAPPLAISKWVQGEPVPQLEKGKIYVIEFWATSCGPCVQLIPHLSRLQEQYKDKGVIFIGIDSGEPDGAAKVPPLVARMGKQMNYRVAVDDYSGTEEGRTYVAWEKATGNDAFPCSIIVGRDGRIAGYGTGIALEQTVAGTFDPIKEYGGREAQRLMQRAANTRDPVEANRIYDEAARLPDHPPLPEINASRIGRLIYTPKTKVEQAYDALERLVAAPGARAVDVTWPAEMVLNGWNDADSDRVLAILERAAALPGDDVDRVFLLAARFTAYNRKGDFAAAANIASQLAKAPGDDPRRLLSVAWAMARREDADAGYLAAARELGAHANGMKAKPISESVNFAPDVATNQNRVRIGLALRSGDRAAVDDAIRQVTQSPDATPDGLKGVSDYLAGLRGYGLPAVDASLALLDRAAALAEDPAAREMVAQARFKALLAKHDFSAAYALTREVADRPDASASVLNSLAWTIATDAPLTQRDLDLAQRMAERAVALTENKDANKIDTYARVMYEKGKVARAVELEGQAAKIADRPDIRAALDLYKSKLAATPSPQAK